MLKELIKKLHSVNFRICTVIIQEVNHLRTLEGVDKKLIKSDAGGRDAAKKVNIPISIISR